MNICSLLPGATEIVAALGLADRLVGISHECDFPAAIRNVPVMVESAVGHGSTDSATIDRQVKDLVSSGQPLYRLNEQAFLSAAPTVVLTQDLCHVCAVTPNQLHRVLQSLPAAPQILTLNPTSLGDVVNDVERIGAVLGENAKGRAFAQALHQRIAAVRNNSLATKQRPRVLCLEWLDPIYIGGHWIPEMVTLAGGQDVLGQARQPSREISWDDVHAAKPDIVVLMPCGFSVERTITEIRALCTAHSEWAHALAQWPKTYVVDAGSYFSRPGPRLVDGLELLAGMMSGTIPPRFGKDVAQDITGTSHAVSASR
ncbi:MAG TPA: cobalamin-binding protein [Nitrospira sp.]